MNLYRKMINTFHECMRKLGGKNIVSTVIIMQIILFNKRNENVNFFDEKTKVNVKKKLHETCIFVSLIF